jgi:glycosyltransferase involved in cell wall biosynthesis
MEQTYRNIQYVFVDDCSPDQSLRILQDTISEYPDRKDDILIVSHEHNRGLSAARNTAVANATGEFIFHVDSDDYIEKDAINNLVVKQTKTDADIVTGLSLAEYKDYKSIIELREYKSTNEMIFDMIQPTIRHTIWGRLIRHSLYTDYHLKATEGVNVGEDVQIMPCLAYFAKKSVNCYNLIYHYNCENESSYIHVSADINRKIRKVEQDVKSYLVLRNFFQEKNSVFLKESEKAVSFFSQELMEYYIVKKDVINFNRIKNIYRQLSCDYVDVATWHKFHDRTFYNYYFCIITHLLRPQR